MTEERIVEPPMESHRPASETSQDISHVLAAVFKEVYDKNMIGEDTLTSNLIKTNAGRSSYHQKYVKELQQVRCEYEQSIKQAELTENHIIQARARSVAKESLDRERMKADTGDACDHQPALFTVKSTFSWCVDEDLLKGCNLISPGDYLNTQKAQVPAPAAIKSSFAKPTITYGMHTSREPQDDGYTLIPNPKKTVLEMNELDDSLTFESSSDTQQRMRAPQEAKARPKWLGQPSAQDRADGWENLQRFKGRQRFLRNPRFLPANAKQCGKSLIPPKAKGTKENESRSSEKQSSADDLATVFQAKPSVILFSEYSVGRVYESTLELKNVTSTSRHVRVIPPTTPVLLRWPGKIPQRWRHHRPGMSCKYTLRFAPDSLGDYKDFMVVETVAERLFVVPIEARRPPPILTLPRVVDCGYCLVGGVKFVELLCQNVGLSPGTFYIIPKDQWPRKPEGKSCIAQTIH